MTASEEITAEVTGWPGVTAGPGSRGEFSFAVIQFCFTATNPAP